MRVKLGATRRSQTTKFQEIDAEKLIPHENYIPGDDPMSPFSDWMDNDIGLVKLSEKYLTSGIT